MNTTIPSTAAPARPPRVVLKALCLAWLALALPAHAQDCTLAGWSESQPNAVNVGGPPAIARYSGRCAIQVTQPGRYLHTTHPNAEAAYYARFYYYTGTRSGGAIDIFQGRDGTNLPIRVEHEATASSNRLRFSTTGSAQLRTADVQANKWYAIELAWTTGNGSGQLGITITGAGVSTPIPVNPITGLSNNSQRIREIRMGWITTGGSGAINFDAFEARRDGAPGRLCRGDAVPDSVRNVSDIGAVIGEINGHSVAMGQPDANQDGAVDVFDLGVLQGMVSDPNQEQCP